MVHLTLTHDLAETQARVTLLLAHHTHRRVTLLICAHSQEQLFHMNPQGGHSSRRSASILPQHQLTTVATSRLAFKSSWRQYSCLSQLVLHRLPRVAEEDSIFFFIALHHWVQQIGSWLHIWFIQLPFAHRGVVQPLPHLQDDMY